MRWATSRRRLRRVYRTEFGRVDKNRLFVEFPAGVSKVETILGTACRVLPNDAGDAKHFAYRIGKAKIALKRQRTFALHVRRCISRSLRFFRSRGKHQTAN